MAVPFAVVGCSSCRRPWVVDLRHATSTCPRCGVTADLERRAQLWQGEDARAAQQAAARLRAGDDLVVVTALADRRPMPHHDSAVAAAAAKAASVINKSQKADLIALWLTRLTGEARHEDLLAAMEQAGLARDRAEQEVIRMLATDVMYEPRAGSYRVLE